ncbi:hypothetical protein GW17_00048786 [Ensete ventricosum]|nr:hypothetical protein GW17_00048786 [Ensete ventricosum]
MPVYTWTPNDSSLALKRCASSSGCQLVDRKPGQSPHAEANFWSLVELQSLRVRCDAKYFVSDLVWLRPLPFNKMKICHCSLVLSPSPVGNNGDKATLQGTKFLVLGRFLFLSYWRWKIRLSWKLVKGSIMLALYNGLDLPEVTNQA